MNATATNRTVGSRIGNVALSPKSYDFIRALLREQTGIVLAEHKRDLVYRRLVKRLRELGLDSFEAYCDLLSGPGRDSEIQVMRNALTTNLTKFFRENHHFEHLAGTAIPQIVADAQTKGRRRLRIWSAGCSSGEEPYSIAITVCRNLKALEHWDARILATDIDTNMVETGRSGIYPQRNVGDIPAPVLKRFFQPTDSDGAFYRVSQAARSLIAFKPLNLLEPWPMKGPFDVIFCRNVVIYFDKPTQRQLFDRYADFLKDGGYLYVGHSESLFNVTDRFKSLGQSIYQKIS